MKRAGNLLERIAARDNLRIAFHRAMRGKRHRDDVREFAANLENNLRSMAGKLHTGEFPVGRYTEFTIYDPKQRTITAPCFAERLLHRAIMRVCEPLFEKYLIHDTYACRKGKGRVRALQRATHFSRRDPVILKMDMRKYFHSISHQGLRSRLHRIFKDKQLLELLGRIIDSYQASPGRGLAIGSLTSQHFANFYLSFFDRFVKETLRVSGYVRYMDDCVIWGDSAQTLRDIEKRCRCFLDAELSLQLKQDVIIRPVRGGFEFLGCRVFPSHLVLSRRSRKRFRRRMTDLELSYLQGDISDLELQQRATSLVAFTTAGGTKSWKFRSQMLERIAVNGHGHEPGDPGRKMEQQGSEPPVGVPQ